MPHLSNEWHLRDAEAVASVLNTNIYRGLSDAEVRRRRRRDGRNNVWHVKRDSATAYAVRSIGDLTSAVLVIAALTAAIFERSALAGAVCAILVIGVIMRVLAYVKARRTLETMADEGIPSATVIRDGTATVIRADEIVVGDIIMLCAGDIVPCDGRIVSGDDVRVSERGITENRAGVIKGATVILTDSAGSEMPCEYRVNMLFAGSTVLAGECRMIAVSCGEDTLVAAKHGGLAVPSGDEIPVIEELAASGRRWNLVMLACVFVTVTVAVSVSMARHGEFGFSDIFINAMALAASSAGTYLIPGGYIALAVSLRRAAGGRSARAVVKDPSRVERVADVRRIIVSDIAELKSGEVTYTSCFANGKLRDVSCGDTSASEILGFCAQTRSRDSGNTVSTNGTKIEDDIFSRIVNAASREHGIDAYRSAAASGVTVDMSVTHASDGTIHNAIVLSGGVYYFRISGDLRCVLSMCDRYRSGSGDIRMTDSVRAEIFRAADAAFERGAVVIATAHRESPYTTLKRTSTLQSALCFDGFIVADEEACASDGSPLGSLILLSSHPERDRCYLVHARLVPHTTPVIDCREVLSGGDIPDGSVIISVPKHGESERGIDPLLKVKFAVAKRISESYSGTAVMTADPSEAGMINESSVGIAVSRSAGRPIPQALKRRAAVSVYPSGRAAFSPIAGAAAAIASSCRATDGIRRVVIYSAAATSARVALMLLSVVFSVPFVTSATLLLLGMVSDFSAVLAIGFAAAASEAPRRAERNGRDVMRGIVFGIITGCAVFALTYLMKYIPGISMAGEAATVCAALLLWQPAAVVLLIPKGTAGNTACIANVLISVAACGAAVLVPQVSSFLGSALPPYYMLPAVIVPAAVTLAVGTAVRRVRERVDSVHD